MATPALPLKEFDLEMASTRKLLERVRSDKAAWKPRSKFWVLGSGVPVLGAESWL